MRKFFLVILWVIILGTRGEAAPIEPAVKSLAKDVILSIYHDLSDLKTTYRELAGFNEKCFFENKDGIYAIFYEAKVADARSQLRPYAFGLTIEQISARTFADKEGVFSFGFPALGIKFSGFQSPRPKKNQLDLQNFINRYGIRISLEEQKRLPLRLELIPTKQVFKTGEAVEFEAVLTNVGTTNIFVKKLDATSLYFLFNKIPWGTPTKRQAQGGERTMLPRGQSLRARFKGEAYSAATEIDIHAVYRLLVNGVNPFATLKVRIVQ